MYGIYAAPLTILTPPTPPQLIGIYASPMECLGLGNSPSAPVFCFHTFEILSGPPCPPGSASIQFPSGGHGQRGGPFRNTHLVVYPSFGPPLGRARCVSTELPGAAHLRIKDLSSNGTGLCGRGRGVGPRGALSRRRASALRPGQGAGRAVVGVLCGDLRGQRGACWVAC